MSTFDPQATTFNATDALLLAQASQAAYMDEAGASAAMAQLGLPKFKWIDLRGLFDDLYAFAAGDGGFAILAFRGTKSFKNWMTDFYSMPARFSWLFEGAPEVGDVHAGRGDGADLADALNGLPHKAGVEESALKPPMVPAITDVARTKLH